MELTTSYQLISSFNLTYGAIRTYAKYSSQSSTDNTTTYQIKQVYYCSVSGGYTAFDYATAVLDGTQKIYNGYTRMYSGETTIQELNRVIEHNPDGSTPVRNIATSWTASFGGNGSTSVDITFPNIARYPILTNATDFNDEQNPTIYFTNVLGMPGASVSTILVDPNTGVQMPGITWKNITDVSLGYYTYNLTNAEKDALRTWCNTSNSKEIWFVLLTEYNGTQYWSPLLVRTYSIINANPTFTASYLDTNSTTTTITGNNQKIIQNNSTLRVNIANATALKQASLSNVRVTINGITTTQPISTSSLAIDIGTVNLSSNTSIPVVLTDSRGNTAQVNLNLQVLPYQLPNAIIDLKRKQNYYTETDITPDASYSSLDGNNTLTIQYRIKKTSEGSYGSYASLTNNTTTTFNADNQYAWDIQVLLTDRIGSTTYNLTISPGIPILFIDRQKYSVGINCFPSKNNSIEVNGNDISNTYYFDETPVGTWVDGKTLYRKVFLITSQDTLHGISNPHYTSIVSAMVYDSSLYGSRDVSSDIIFQSNKFWLTGNALSLVSNGINLIVEYTKN